MMTVLYVLYVSFILGKKRSNLLRSAMCCILISGSGKAGSGHRKRSLLRIIVQQYIRDCGFQIIFPGGGFKFPNTSLEIDLPLEQEYQFIRDFLHKIHDV